MSTTALADSPLAGWILQSGRLPPPAEFSAQIVVTRDAPDWTEDGLLSETSGVCVQVEGPAPIRSYVLHDGSPDRAAGYDGVEPVGPRYNRVERWSDLFDGPLSVARLHVSPELVQKND